MIDNLLKVLEKLQDSAFLRTKKGLFFVFAIIAYIVNLLPIDDNIAKICVYIFFVCLYCISWYYFSGRLFFSSKIQILFAIDSSKESKEYCDKVIKSINFQIDQLNLNRTICIRQMPSDLSFGERAKAERYIKTRMIDLLVWGHTLDGRLQEAKVSEFNLRFSYLYAHVPQQISQIFLKEIDKGSRRQYWKILEDRSFNDLKVVSTNIVEVSLFIIGLCLFIRGELLQSIEILEKVRFLLKNKNEVEFPDIKNVKKQIDLYLADSYRLVGQQIKNDRPQDARQLFQKLLEIIPDDSGAHLEMAKLVYVIDKDVQASRIHTDKVTSPDLKQLTNYNYAFYAIREKDSATMLKYYQKIRSAPSQNIIEILDFLRVESAKDSDNILYLFALGYLNIYHGDISVGVGDLKEFIEKAKVIPEYEILVQNAEPLLKRREKQK